MRITVSNLEFEVETFGSKSDPSILLIAGLGFQLIDWPADFCQSLAIEGFHVIRFDNRDIGLSDGLAHEGIPDLAAVMGAKLSGAKADVPYSLHEMAADAAGLLEELADGPAHIVGMSMGGMIAQLLAIHYPEQVKSLTSIMSSSSAPDLPGPREDAAKVLASAPLSQEMKDIVAFGLKVNDVIGSPGFRWDRELLETHIRNCVERAYRPDGYMRQYAAVLSANSRREDLQKVTSPTLVIHGSDDPLVQPVCGEDVAKQISGAKFSAVEGMGHDLSPSLCQHLSGLILDHVKPI